MDVITPTVTLSIEYPETFQSCYVNGRETRGHVPHSTFCHYSAGDGVPTDGDTLFLLEVNKRLS